MFCGVFAVFWGVRNLVFLFPPSGLLFVTVMVFSKQRKLKIGFFIVLCSCWCLFLQSDYPWILCYVCSFSNVKWKSCKSQLSKPLQYFVFLSSLHLRIGNTVASTTFWLQNLHLSCFQVKSRGLSLERNWSAFCLRVDKQTCCHIHQVVCFHQC